MTSGSGLPLEFVKQKLFELGRYNSGVWRGDLIAFLGSELVAHLHMVTERKPGGPEIDSIDVLRAKVIWHLRQVVRSTTSDEEQQQALDVRFNITQFPELRGMQAIKSRAEWCQEHHGWQCVRTIGTLTSLKGKGTLLPELARQLALPQQPPRQADIAAILSEIRGLALSSPSDGDQPAEKEIEPANLEDHEPEHRPTTRLARFRSRVLRALVGQRPIVNAIIAGTLATVLGTAIYTWTMGAPQNPLVTPGGASPTDQVLPPTGAGSDGSVVPDLKLLKATYLSVQGMDRWHVVFPSGAQNISKFTTQNAFPSDQDAFLTEELNAGAYLAGVAVIRLEVENYADRELTLYDVKVGSLKKEPVPFGAAILMGAMNQGETPRELFFDIDDVPPIAKAEKETDGYYDFFDKERIGIRPGYKETLRLVFSTDRAAAYSFDIQLYYELGGTKYVQTVKRNGMPFRLAVHPCYPSDSERRTKYELLRGQEPLPLPPGVEPRLRTLSPATFCKELGFE